LEKKGDPSLAEQSFTSAVTADPQCAELQDAWEARARVRVKLGKGTEARQDYERCAEISKETVTGKICVRELAKLPPSPTPPGSMGGAPLVTPAQQLAHPPLRSVPLAVNPNDTRKM
jgi:hypothetical protein